MAQFKRKKIFRVAVILLTIFLLFCCWEVWYRTTWHPDDTLKTLQSAFRKNQLIGNSIDECGYLFGDELYFIPSFDGEKNVVYAAGRSYCLGFIGLTEYQYYKISVKCDKNGIITDADLSARKVT